MRDGLITLDSGLKLVISKEMKNVQMDEMTREWFYGYEGKQIHLPDKFLPGKNFIEYHNDVIFLRRCMHMGKLSVLQLMPK